MPFDRSYVLFLTAALLGAAPAAAETQSLDIVGQLSASTIAAISDGDFLAETYGNGQLPPREAGHRDLLTVFSKAGDRIVTGTIEISNSVTATPEILALSKDGETAFIAERLGQRPPHGETLRDLPPGRRLFAVDLADKSSPRLADSVEIAALPESLSVSPDGRHIAVVSNPAEGSFLQIVPYEDGRFGAVARFDLAELGIAGSAPGPRGGVLATNVHWHPSGRFLAVNINTQNRVAFFEVALNDGEPALRPWGNVVEVGTDPLVGRFTPDGQYYLTSNWGRDLTTTEVERRLPETPSTISVVRLADRSAASVDGARHEIAGVTETDLSAEGIAVSPDSRFVATVNMRGTAFPTSSARFTREGTVTLLTFDPPTGLLTKVADFPFEGVLPEGGSFDATGGHFLATVFQGHADASRNAGAGLEVFRVVKGERPRLERVGRVPLPHGAHHVDVAP